MPVHDCYCVLMFKFSVLLRSWCLSSVAFIVFMLLIIAALSYMLSFFPDIFVPYCLVIY